LGGFPGSCAAAFGYFLTQYGFEYKIHKIKEANEFAQKQEFEKAARFRDSYLDVTKTLERQKVV